MDTPSAEAASPIAGRFLISGMPPTVRWVDFQPMKSGLLGITAKAPLPEPLFRLATLVREQRRPCIQFVDHDGRVILVRLAPINNGMDRMTLDGELYDVTDQVRGRIAGAYGAGTGFVGRLAGIALGEVAR